MYKVSFYAMQAPAAANLTPKYKTPVNFDKNPISGGMT
jgi:hypothetical protein